MTSVMSRRFPASAACVTLGLLLVSIAMSARQAAQGRLSISPNHRFFQRADGSPFF